MTKPIYVPEREILAEGKLIIKLHGYKPERNNNGQLFTSWGKRISVGRKHDPDIKFFMSEVSKTVWIEFKSPGKKPNQGQIDRMIELNQNGDIAVWLDSPLPIYNLIREVRLGSKIAMERDGRYEFIRNPESWIPLPKSSQPISKEGD